MKHLFIVNPHSFSAQEEMDRLMSEIIHCFHGGNNHTIHISRYPRDAIAVIHNFLQQVPFDETVRVYAVGGDGILFDCLNGMAEWKNAELTCVPYGKTNDFVRAFGDNAKVRFRDISQLINAPAQLIDIFNCGNNYALNHVAVGIEAQAALNVNALMKKIRIKWLNSVIGKLYIVSAALTIFDSEVINQHYRLIMDGMDMSGNYCNVHIANNPCTGGNMILNYNAKPDNGLINVLLAKSSSIPEMIKAIFDLTTGHFERNEQFTSHEVSRLEITSDLPMRIHMDGEAFYFDSVKIEILPKSVRFFAPRGMYFLDYSVLMNRNKKGGGWE